MKEQAVEETYERSLYWVIKNQMEEAGIRFDVPSLEEAEDKIQMTVNYVADVYQKDGENAYERVLSWLTDAKMQYPEEFVAIAAE